MRALAPHRNNLSVRRTNCKNFRLLDRAKVASRRQSRNAFREAQKKAPVKTDALPFYRIREAAPSSSPASCQRVASVSMIRSTLSPM